MDGETLSASPGSRSLSLVLPAYNEAAAIATAIEEADQALWGLCSDYEIIVVDDGSKDGTAGVVRGLAGRLPRVRLLQHETNQGYGTALRTGFLAATKDRVAFTDADSQFHLEDLGGLLERTDAYPIAVGYRIGRQDPWQRRFFSWGYNTLVRTLLGTRVRDCDCALKVFRREALADLIPRSNGFFVNTEMLTRARQGGHEVVEVGVRHRPRRLGTSKVTLGDIPRTLKTLLPFWWSEVLFPSVSGPVPANNAQAGWLFTLLLVVMAGLLFFTSLACPLQEPEEPRYAEIPRQMLQAGNFLVPMLHGQGYYDKPPLLYWLVMGSYAVFGIHDWAARLVPSGAAFFTVLVTYFWGRRALGLRGAFIAAAMLCLSARFVYLGRLLTMNGLLALWVVAGLAGCHLAIREGRFRWGWWLLAAVAGGLGILTKGPVALILILIPAVLIVLLDGRVARPRFWHWAAFPAVATILAAPWFISMAVLEPEFLTYFFWRHNVERFVQPFDHSGPLWYYLSDLGGGMLPWTLLLVPLARSFRHSEGPRPCPRPEAAGFFLLAASWCLCFYSVAGSKRAGYILPAMPLLALALGGYLDRVLGLVEKMPEEIFAAWRRFGLGTAQAVLIAGIGASLAAPSLQLLPGAMAGLLFAGLSLGLLALRSLRQPLSPKIAWGLCGVATFAVLQGAISLGLPSYAGQFALRDQLQPLAAVAQDAQVPIVSYPRRWDSVSFYLQRDDVRVYTRAQRDQLWADLCRSPETLAIVKSEQALDDLLQHLPGTRQFVPSSRQGAVTVGWIRPRPEAPAAYFASRSTKAHVH